MTTVLPPAVGSASVPVKLVMAGGAYDVTGVKAVKSLS
jgi:hypothetical protein